MLTYWGLYPGDRNVTFRDCPPATTPKGATQYLTTGCLIYYSGYTGNLMAIQSTTRPCMITKFICLA